MLILITLFSLSKTQIHIFLSSLYQQETIKSYHNFLDHFIGMNIKQKVGIKIQQMYIDIFPNNLLMESIDYFFSLHKLR